MSKYETKIDPVTGCKVLTNLGFWQSEADKTGLKVTDLMNDFYSEIDVAREEQAKENEKNAHEFIAEHLDGFEDPTECMEEYGFLSKHIVKVEVEGSECNGNLREENNSVVAKLTLTDGSTRKICLDSWHDYGDRMNPPDGGEDLTIVEVNGKRVRYSQEFYHNEKEALVCEACKIFGGPDTRNYKPNASQYIVPISSDNGLTVRWSNCCVYHINNYKKFAGWYGPILKLQYKNPELPEVKDGA